jgi:hypothetical protein
MGTSQQGVYTGRMRHGFGQYFMGTGFLFIFASALSRVNEKPYILGSMAMLWGWLKSALLRNEQYGDEDFRKFLRKYQWRVLMVGKTKAIDEINKMHELS